MRITLAHDVATMRAVDDLLAATWGMAPGPGPVPVDVLRSVEHSGGAVHVAHSGSTLVGAAVAFFGPPADRVIYSMIAAASSSDRGVGYALKQAQREWALSHGATTMRWTFDPLVSRNARFNLVKLGAIAGAYAVDFYGPMSDGIQGIDESDRLTVTWSLADPVPPVDIPGPASPTGIAPDGGTLFQEGPTVWCRVPTDIVALRRADPAQASAWRLAVRSVLAPAMASGMVATGITRDGWYRLERP